MDFKSATDELFEPVRHEDLAKKLGVSIATIRQARLREDARSFRAPPENWRDAVVRLAEKQIMHHRRLIERIAKNGSCQQ